jgi:hypothetical protein
MTSILRYNLQVPSGLAARNVWELPTPPVNVLAFIQTVTAPLLFQVHPGSRLSLLLRHKRPIVENKIALPPVLTWEASLIEGNL